MNFFPLSWILTELLINLIRKLFLNLKYIAHNQMITPTNSMQLVKKYLPLNVFAIPPLPHPPPKKKSVPYNVLDEEAIPFSFLANDKTTLLINVILR